MEIYLVIITTVLVLTQVIRVSQNYIQLRHLKNKELEEIEIREEWRKLCKSIDRLNKNIGGD